MSETFEQKIRVSVVASGIARPWALLPLPDGDMLVSIRATGQVLAIRKGQLNRTALTGLPAMHLTRTTGMLDMVPHPKYADNKLVFFTYHKQLAGDTYTLALGRARYDGANFADFKELYAGNPVRTGGSRLAFGLDGLLYITVGGANRIPEAQALDSIFGKTIRLKEDGTVLPTIRLSARLVHDRRSSPSDIVTIMASPRIRPPARSSTRNSGRTAATRSTS